MKKLAISLGITLVLVSASAAFLRREAAALRAQNMQAEARVSASEVARATGTSVVRPDTQGSSGNSAGPAAGAGLTQSEVATVAPASPVTRGSSAGAGANPFAEAMRLLQSSPESLEAARIMMRPMVEEKYQDLAKEMNLTPDQAGKVLDLLARQQMEEATDLFDATADPQDHAAREQIARAKAKSAQTYQSELSALLGSSYPKWAEYETKVQDRQRDMYTRMGQEQIRSTINGSGTPLTDAQFRYLNQALEAEQERIDRETTSPQQQIQRLPETNRRLLGVASSHLNPQQLERYRQYLQQQEEMMSMMDGMGVLR